MSTLQTSQFSELTRKSRKIGSSAVDSISVSQLYSLVKKYDKDFHAGKKVSPYLLNENGTPRKFYHGTAEKSLAYWYGRNIKGLLEYAVNNDAPYVLKDGEVIDYQTNWKNRGYDTAVIVAPITIATVFGRDGLYDYIQSEIIKGNLVRIKNRSNQVGELTAEIADSYGKIASTNSIRNNSENVKTKVFK